MATSGARTGAEPGTATSDTNPDQAPPSPFDEEDYRLALRLRPGLYCQVTQEHVSFDYIAKAWRIRNNPAKPAGDDEKLASRVLEYLARRQFSKEHEGIQKDYWSRKPWAGCALTGDGWVHSVMNITDPELVLYEDRIHQLCRDSHRTFEVAAQRNKAGKSDQHQHASVRISWRHDNSQRAQRDLMDAGEMLYSVLTRVILTASVLKDEDATQQQRDEALAAVRIAWKSVRASVEGMIQRHARFEYFEGVGLGTFFTIPLLVVAGWAAVRYGTDHLNEPDEPGAFAAAIIGGAAGAVISVTQRMTANTLMLDFAAPKRQKIALGMLRPIVGAVFGAVVYFAIIGGLLAVEARTGKDSSIALAFFAVTGFAAGFSERFATDVLDRASSGILPASRRQQGVEKPDEPSLLLSEQPRHAEAPTVIRDSHRRRRPSTATGARPANRRITQGLPRMPRWR